MASFKPLLMFCLLCAPALTLAEEESTFGLPNTVRKDRNSIQSSSTVATDEYGLPVQYFVKLNERDISSEVANKQRKGTRSFSAKSASEQAKSATESLIDDILSSAPQGMKSASNGGSSSITPTNVFPKGASLQISADLAKKLSEDSRVESVTVDPARFVMGFPDRNLLAETVPYGIEMVKADQVEEVAGDKKLCIIDSGLNTDHEDYEGKIFTGKSTGNDQAWDSDMGCAHGTHCTGSIAARGDNSKGVTSVNPKGLLEIHVIKVFPQTGGSCSGASSSAVRTAMEECVAWGANIVSMSLGGGAPSAGTEKVISDASDVLWFAAAGNGGNTALSYPASYDQDNLASVAAIDSNKNKASFSQWNDQVDLSGPGVQILSTTKPHVYQPYSGTSMACPHVAGVAALIWNRNPSCTAAQVMRAMQLTAEDLGAFGRDNEYGHGLVDAKAADGVLAGEECGDVQYPPAAPTAAPTPPPTEAWTGIMLKVKYDNYPGETSYEIRKDGELIKQGTPPLGAAGAVVQEEVFPLVADVEYTLIIDDSYGDGICCAHGDGYYQVYTRSNGADFVLAHTGGNFTLTDTSKFTIGDSSNPPEPTPAPTYPFTSPPTPSPTSPIAAGTCCEGRGDDGCEDNGCQVKVCEKDPYCCDEIWDRKCVDMAEEECPLVCTGPTCCFGHADNGCDATECETKVCEIDSYCCQKFWDRDCAAIAETQCGEICD